MPRVGASDTVANLEPIVISPPVTPRVGAHLSQVNPAALTNEEVLVDAWFDDYWFDGASEFVYLAQSRIEKGSFAGSRWYRSNWVDLAITGTDLANSWFEAAGWHRCAVTDSRLTGLAVTGCTLQHITCTRAQADYLTWRFGTANRVQFDSCALRGADFSGTTSTEVSFIDCDLSGAKFDQVKIDRVHLDRGNLEQVSGLAAGMRITTDNPGLLAYQLAEIIGICLD